MGTSVFFVFLSDDDVGRLSWGMLKMCEKTEGFEETMLHTVIKWDDFFFTFQCYF